MVARISVAIVRITAALAVAATMGTVHIRVKTGTMATPLAQAILQVLIAPWLATPIPSVAHSISTLVLVTRASIRSMASTLDLQHVR